MMTSGEFVDAVLLAAVSCVSSCTVSGVDVCIGVGDGGVGVMTSKPKRESPNSLRIAFAAATKG